MQKHIQHNKDERTQFFRKNIPLTLFERVIVWEVSWRLNRTATYWPPNSSGYNSISFPFSWAALSGTWGPSLSWDMILIPASSLQLIWLPVAPSYIIIWRLPTSCERHIDTQFNPSTVNVVPRYLRLDAPVIYTGAFLLLTAWPRANMQQNKAMEFAENNFTIDFNGWLVGFMACQSLLVYLMLKSVFFCEQLLGFK